MYYLILCFLLNAIAISNAPDDEFTLILPSEIPTDIVSTPLNNQTSDNDLLLETMGSEKSNLRHKHVRIGQNEYLILKKLGDGAEGLVYTAKDPNDTIVVVKAILPSSDAKESYDNEVYALRMLNRLVDYDEKHMIIVETMILGDSLDIQLDRYAKENVGKNEFPSDRIPLHSKEKYFQILWDFRNATKMVHGDFRPYNVIGDQVIDFGRTEPLSRNFRRRKRQLRRDDDHALKEWTWYYCYSDWDKIEENPFIPNAFNRAQEIWDIYVERYDDVAKGKKYRNAWMHVLKKIHDTNDTSLKFPRSRDFEGLER